MDQHENQRVILKSRPGVNGEPTADNFAVEKCDMPLTDSLKPGQLLIKNLYLSVDPVLRCRMNEDSGVDYVSAWQIGGLLDGIGGVGEVAHSNDPDFSCGDLVAAFWLWPWASYFVYDSKNVRKLPKELFSHRPALALSGFGGTSLTAYLGMAERGHLSPGANQTVVVSGAAGATGSVAGQVARALGAKRVVGICGSEEKCQYLLQELGFDAAVNYKQGSVPDQLTKACPEGVHVYFDNVGGDISEQVIEQMVPDSHVILCGQVSVYNKDVPYPPPLSPKCQQLIQERKITRERFMVLSYQEKFEETLDALMQLYQAGKFKVKETVMEGLENAGKAFVSMMRGGNIGKQVVKVQPN